MKKTFNWNWGKSITVAIIMMCSGILFIVYKATTYNYDLVIDNYYEEELNFDNQALALANAKQLTNDIKIINEDNFLLIEFPEECMNQELKGSLKLYRASDASKDIELPIEFTIGTIMSIPKDATIKGNYNLIATWAMNGKEYKCINDLEIK